VYKQVVHIQTVYFQLKYNQLQKMFLRILRHILKCYNWNPLRCWDSQWSKHTGLLLAAVCWKLCRKFEHK